MKKRVELKEKPRRILSRFFNAILVVAFFALLILATLGLSYVVTTVNQVNGRATEVGASPGCLIDPTADGTGTTVLSQSATCGFLIWGQAVVMAFSVVTMGYMVFKIIVGFKM